jgi:hypothetical protein
MEERQTAAIVLMAGKCCGKDSCAKTILAMSSFRLLVNSEA